MDLKDFVKNTLVEITNGVIEAQKELEGTGCLVNPEGYSMKDGQVRKGYNNEFRAVQKVKINVLVDVSEEEGTKAGIGVLKVIKAGIDTSEQKANSQRTSLEFEIPISLPTVEH